MLSSNSFQIIMVKFLQCFLLYFCQFPTHYRLHLTALSTSQFTPIFHSFALRPRCQYTYCSNRIITRTHARTHALTHSRTHALTQACTTHTQYIRVRLLKLQLIVPLYKAIVRPHLNIVFRHGGHIVKRT